MQKRQRGLGLIELMIAIALSLVLSGALIQAYLASRSTFQMQDSMSLLQENGRFAINYLTKEARMAGFIGCPDPASPDFENTLSSPASGANDFPRFDAIRPIVVATYNKYPLLAASARADSDVLIIQRGSTSAMPLGDGGLAGQVVTVDANTAGVVNNDILLISNCARGNAFLATGIAGNAITTSTTLPQAYQEKTAAVMALESTVYFVKDSGRKVGNKTDGKPIYSLWMRTRGAGSGGAISDAVELVEGVEAMQVQFGINTDNDPNRTADTYVPISAGAFTNWDQVVSIRISLLMQGVDDKAVSDGKFAQQTTTFNGHEYAADGRLRQVFTTTVGLRGRLL